MVIHIDSDEELFIRIGLNSQTPYFLLYKAQSIKDPRIYFFKELTGKKIKNLEIIPYDKIISIMVKEYTLKCIFFGRDKNIALTGSENTIIQTFKKSQSSFNSQLTVSQDENLSLKDFAKTDQTKINQNLRSFLLNRVGGFNKLLSDELCFRAETNPELLVSNLKKARWDNISQHIVKILEELKNDECYLYEHPQNPAIISLIQLKKVPEDYSIMIYHDVNTAWKQYIYRFQQKYNLERILHRSREKITRRINYLEKTLKKVSDFNELEEKKKLSEQKGHLLQTFSSEIKKGVDLVKLKNIYSTKEEYISIKLNPKLSIQENAIKYFNKYKDINAQKRSLKTKQDTYENELIFWKKMYHDTEKIDNLKKVEKLDQILSQKKLIQKSGKEKKADTFLDISSFNRVLLNRKWEILIGKNAENNDLLTFKFARNHDIWLHAQGVSGSHVVIRIPDKNVTPPIDIIEQAASVAAYFSSARNSSTVPVNYTEVRYVRKPRKAPTGTAMITNSKTIFVEPKKYI
jgi:predicted ribosome quality control (RQC) complex YloA/Tae2 family protein